MKQLAIIGPTASGKSDLAIEVALKHNAYILSIDSLSIYKEVDIVSAKPSKEELAKVKHFGIDELYINEYFSVEIFIKLYKEVQKKCVEDGKNLVIVGGTSFYLKTLISGLSPVPKIDKETKEKIKERMENLQQTYETLYNLDKPYMEKIAPSDRYRIEKALSIFEATGKTPSEWFALNPPKPIIKELPIYEIAVDRELLRERIRERTKKMLQAGLIDEVRYLEQTYTREPNAMKSIGIVETLDYLDGKIDQNELQELISIHTGQLAKRQQTFNKSQFKNKVSLELEALRERLLNLSD